MKISYRREMKHNYLIIDPESLIWRNYECRMLASNTIEGVLHFQIRQVDDEIRFYYEITSRQPLERMLENQSLQVKELRSLMFGISRVLDRMEQYLLREGSVLLEPDYIYVEPETFRVWLCLVPGLERDFRKDYGNLLEYLLGKADHQDKDSVVLAYGLYQESRRDNYGMEDILRLLRTGQEEPGQEQYEVESCEAQQQEPEEWRVKRWKQPGQEVLPGEKPDSENGSTGRSGVRKHKTLTNRKSVKDSRAEHDKKGAGLWNRLRMWWSSRMEKGEPDIVQVPWEMMFHEDVSEEKEKPAKKAVEKTAEMLCKEVQPGQDTVLLADLGGEKGTGLCRLDALDGDLENIIISYYPFIIGKQENLVDYVLDSDTVSRLHMRIDRQGEKYFVQDLNSTNGTTVAGHLLENNESVEIHHGDEICIARCRFRFGKA